MSEDNDVETPKDSTNQEHISAEGLLTWLRDKQVSFVLHHHPPLHSVEDARTMRGDLGGAYVKNLFLRDRSGKLFLLTCLSHQSVNLQWLRREVGCRRLSFVKPDQLWSMLGVRPGSVSPFALINATQGSLIFLADEELKHHDLCNFHPLSNEMTVQIKLDDWVDIVESWGFPPSWIRFSHH